MEPIEVQSTLETVKLSRIERALKDVKKNIPETDADISFEYLVGSFWPNILKNIEREIIQQYLAGYRKGKEDALNEIKGNN